MLAVTAFRYMCLTLNKVLPVYLRAHLGRHWQAKDKAARTAEEGDGSLPRLQGGNIDGHDARDDAVPDAELST